MPELQSSEIFDVVDEQDIVVRQETRGVVHRDGLRHRAVHVFVFNDAGQLYMQRRSPHKDQMPNVWTTSCSGHVDSGEDYNTAAMRELGEELDIQINDADQMELLFKCDACRRTGWEFLHVYKLSWNGSISFDPVEISEGRWYSMSELQAAIDQNRREFAPSFRYIWDMACERNCFTAFCN